MPGAAACGQCVSAARRSCRWDRVVRPGGGGGERMQGAGKGKNGKREQRGKEGKSRMTPASVLGRDLKRETIRNQGADGRGKEEAFVQDQSTHHHRQLHTALHSRTLENSIEPLVQSLHRLHHLTPPQPLPSRLRDLQRVQPAHPRSFGQCVDAGRPIHLFCEIEFTLLDVDCYDGGAA